jgi:hypothetical protein
MATSRSSTHPSRRWRPSPSSHDPRRRRPQHGVDQRRVRRPTDRLDRVRASNLTVTIYRFLPLEDESTGTRRHRCCDRGRLRARLVAAASVEPCRSVDSARKILRALCGELAPQQSSGRRQRHHVLLDNAAPLPDGTCRRRPAHALLNRETTGAGRKQPHRTDRRVNDRAVRLTGRNVVACSSFIRRRRQCPEWCAVPPSPPRPTARPWQE